MVATKRRSTGGFASGQVLPVPTSIAFSGGRTSAYMLRRHLDSHGGELPPNHRVLFCNTGKERDETLDFVHECERRWSVPVTCLEYTTTPMGELDERAERDEAFAGYWRPARKRIKKDTVARFAAMGFEADSMPYHDWKIVDYETAHRNGQPDAPFDKLIRWLAVLPNVRVRACTAQMKIKTMDRYLSTIGYGHRFELIGIRADERHRSIEIRAQAPKRISPQFPLIDLEKTEDDVLGFWRAGGFDLQLESHEGNCDLCFLKNVRKIRRLIAERPHSAEWWAEKEREAKARGGIRDGAKFRADRPSYAAMLEQIGQPQLFEDDDEDIACSCTEGGYKHLNEDE